MFGRDTPNCMLCKWKHKEERHKKTLDTIFEKRRIYMCGAQGLKRCDNCYASRECKKLYEQEKN